MKENNVKIIFHIDMNAFFCSVACILDPSLRGIPFAIGREGTYKGVLSTASYEARALGIHSAMPVSDAYHLCKDLKVIHIDYSYYEKYHYLFVKLIREYTKLIEVASIDEVYADMTEASKTKHPLVLAKEIQARLLKEYNLSCSIGIAPTLFLAKMASDLKKPLGLTVLRKRDVKEILYPLSVKDIYGIGKRTSPTLIQAGIRTIADFMNEDNKQLIIDLVGLNTYQYVVSHILGKSSNIVDPNRYANSRSISTSSTFDVYKTSLSDMEYELRGMTRYVVSRLKDEQYYAKTVTITLRDSDFNTITRQKKLEEFSQDFDEIIAIVVELLENYVDLNKQYRLLGVGLSGLVKKDKLPKNYDIFTVSDVMKKEIIIDSIIHSFQEKYGENVIKRKK